LLLLFREARAAVQRKQEVVQKQREAAEATEEEHVTELLSAAEGDAQRRAAKLLLEEQQKAARIRGQKERTDPETEANAQRRSTNDPALKGAAYLERHHILPLFEMLVQKLLSEKPEDPKQFLVQTLKSMSKLKDPTSPKNFFTDTDIETLYHM